LLNLILECFQKSKLDKKEKNRQKAQVFRQRKKQYIETLESKIKGLESQVWELTQQLEKANSRYFDYPCSIFVFYKTFLIRGLNFWSLWLSSSPK
jgi:hypothetical protein